VSSCSLLTSLLIFPQIEIQKLMAENKRLKKHLKRNRKIIPGKIIDLTDD
jgi:hypothetical protein